MFLYTPCYYIFNKLRDKWEVRRGRLFFVSSSSITDLLSSRIMVARLKYDITDSSIDLLIMVVISGRSWSTHFLKGWLDSGSKSHDLFGDWIIISFTYLNLRTRSKQFELISIKHSICTHGNIGGIIWGIRNYFIPDDCCFFFIK